MANSHFQAPPIVLLITIDALRQDHLGCYGYSRDTTPFIDRLAAQGRRYARAFSPVPVTFPAHCSIFTSRYPGWNGTGVENGGWLRPGQTWVDELNRHGVQTAGFVSSFLLDRRMTRGFDLARYDDRMTLEELNRGGLRRRAETTIDAFLEWYFAERRDSAVFCFLHLMDVHGTYDVPGPVGSQFVRPYYNEEELPICEIYAPGGIPDIYRLDKLPDFPGRQYGSYYADRYDGSIAYVDRQIERLVGQLVQQVPLICLITADHGEAFGEDNYWCTHSHSVQPNQTIVPFVVWSNESGLTDALVNSDRAVSLLDIGPTVLDWLGIAPNPSVRPQGWSLLNHSKPWDTRRLFSIGATQVLSYNAGLGEGVLLGSPTRSAQDLVWDLGKRSGYLDRMREPSEESASEAFLFSILASRLGIGRKLLYGAYLAQHEEQVIARRLADLGYIKRIDSSDPTTGRSFMSLPVTRGWMEARLPRGVAETIARQVQVRPALDLGCGSSKMPGFIGIDRYALPGVDLTGDLDAPLPFPANTFDLVYASHSLEHCQDLTETMKEVFRVSRHGAQVCIVAPYALQGLNLANPYHKQIFNEHTPRFWTNATQTPLEEAEYMHPHASLWGLAESDYSRPAIDLRCLNIEFFYFPQYRNLSPDDRRAARKKYLDVCDQIVYHLVVIKDPMSEADMQELADQIEYYDPPYVAIRRLEEKLEASRIEFQQELEQEKSKVLRAQASLEAERAQTLQIQKRAQAAAEARSDELQQTRAALMTRDLELANSRSRGKTLAAELERYRNRRLTRWTDRFANRGSLADSIAPPFQQLLDDSMIFTKGLDRFRLQPSDNLRQVPFFGYPIDLDLPNLSGLLLAPVLDIPLERGIIGIELVSPANQIVVQTTLPASQLEESAPLRFEFAPVHDSHKGRFWLRVFVRDIDGPLRILEWRRYSWGGLGRLCTRAFCGFLFK